jgi:hypothetical protein
VGESHKNRAVDHLDCGGGYTRLLMWH